MGFKFPDTVDPWLSYVLSNVIVLRKLVWTVLHTENLVECVVVESRGVILGICHCFQNM